jgi:hypothetical protein
MSRRTINWARHYDNMATRQRHAFAEGQFRPLPTPVAEAQEQRQAARRDDDQADGEDQS